MSPPTFDQFANVIRKVFGRADIPVTRETRSVDVPGWDSLSHVMLILALQDEFGAAIEPDETLSLQDVGALYDFLLATLS